MAWLSNYAYRKKITIDHAKVDSTLTDFPMLVKLYYDSSKSAWSGSGSYSVGDIVKNDGSYYKCLTASTSKEPGTTTDWQDDWQFLGYEFDFSKVESSGYDIRFTASDETTLRSFERAEFSKSSEPYSAMFFVLIPSVSSSAVTDIYLYYGYSSATDASAPGTVWADYDLVCHMGSTLTDVSPNGNTVTNNGSTLVDGLNGKGRDFDGNNDFVDVSADTSLRGANISISVIALVDSFSATGSDQEILIRSGYSNDDGNYAFEFSDTPKKLSAYFNDSGGTRKVNYVDNSSTEDIYRQHGVVYEDNASYPVVWIDGIKQTLATSNGPVDLQTLSQDLHIGGRSATGDVTDGIVDEVRLMVGVLPDDYFEVEHADLVRWDLHSIGTEETASQTILGSVSLTGTGILTADAIVEVHGSANLVGSGDIAASGVVEVYGQASLSGAGTLSASGVVQPTAPVLSGEYSGGCISLSW